MNAQISTNLSLKWDIQVGCQVYPDGRKGAVYFEDIELGKCLGVCENTTVKYSFDGDLPENLTTEWTALGGIILSQTSTNMIVDWGASGSGQISFSLNSSNSTILKSLCIDIKQKPFASFTVQGNETDETITVCKGEPISFNNTSSDNGGTAIVSSYWSFMNDTLNPVSSAINPVHIFNETGEYRVKLKVTNACNCISEAVKQIKVIEGKSYPITCASMVCDKQLATYSLELEEANANCNNNFEWQVQGGHIVNNSNSPIIEVLWNDVDASGFGYVTFNSQNCNGACNVPTTIKIPVIQNIGTISGNTNMCVGEQSRFKLPQWATTNFNWTIVGGNGNLATVVATDQRNEVILTANQAGTIVLKAVYENTLLHCGGSATLEITVKNPAYIIGDDNVCLNTTAQYHLASNNPVNWSLTNAEGNIISEINNTPNFNYGFTAANLMPGNYKLTVSGDDICNNQVKFINVMAPPQPPTIAGPIATVVCPNAPTIYSVASPEAGSNYVWEVPDGGSFEGSNVGTSVTIKLTQPGIIKVRHEIYAPTACNSAATEQFVAIEQLKVGISNNITTPPNTLPEMACSNANTVYYALNNTPTGGLYNDPEAFLVWKIYPEYAGSIVSGQNSNTVTVFWNNPTSTGGGCVLKLLVSKCNIPQTVFPKNLVVAALPNLHITASNVQTCSGAPITFTLNTNLPLASSTIVTWDFGTDFPITTSPPGVFSIEKTFYNNSLSNIGYNVSATITNPNGCSGVAKAVLPFTITPGPVTAISVTSGGTVYCNLTEINTSLLATTLTGAGIQWYRNGVPIINATLGTLNITGNAPYGFGAYQFKSSANGCSNISNPILIIQECQAPPTGTCTMPTPSMSIAQTTNPTGVCNGLSFIASASTTPISSRWNVFGPDVSITGQPGNNGAPNLFTLQNITKAGEFHVFYAASYGNNCNFSTYKSITIPYLPDFNYSTTCNGNNGFDLNLTNHSNFISGVLNPQFRYYKATNANGPWTLVGSNANATINNLTQGSYFVKLQIWGTLNGLQQNMCEKIIPIQMNYIVNHTIINSIPTCSDSLVSFEVGNPTPGDTYFWNFGDNATTTVQNPKHMYATSAYNTTVTISLVITNQYGCSTQIQTFLDIPKKCFNGVTGVTPQNATVCKGAPVFLKYVAPPNASECTISKYHWMNNNTEIGITANNSFGVSSNGFYWVRLESSNGCMIDVAENRIVPHFIEPTKVKLSASNLICVGEIGHAAVVTNASIIKWFLDGVLQPNNDNTDFELPNLSLGSHQVSVVVSAYGCDVTASQNITVSTPAATPQIDFNIIDCDIYKIVLNATAAGQGTFNWTNGASTSSISVYEGGPYGVTFTNLAGCSEYTQIDIPKSPESYMWVVPSGCYDLCRENLGSLLGPNIPIKNWEWHENQRGDEHILAQGNEYPDPLILEQNGIYQLELSNGICEFDSSTLNVSYIRCSECPIKHLTLDDVQTVQDGFCNYNATFSGVNQSNLTFELSLNSNSDQFVFVPSSITITPGMNTFTTTIIPLNGFVGGLTTININSILNREETCTAEISIDLPFCSTFRSNKKAGNLEKNANLTVYPNPAQTNVSIAFNTASNAMLFVYDLMGREITHLDPKSNIGTWELSLLEFRAGVYIVVLKEGSQIINQQKLILK